MYMCIYLQAFVDVVAYKGATVVSLPLHVETLKGLVKALVKRPFFHFETLPYLLLYSVYL